MKEKLIQICDWGCGCEFCGKSIKKGDKYLQIYKSAWKGTTRVNICKSCILRLFIELSPADEEILAMKKELILK